MPSLLADPAVRIAHYHMERHKDKEYPVTTFMAAIQAVYFPESLIINASEKPPTTKREDRLRRVDGITHWCTLGSWDLHVGAVWECKKPDATPIEIETCEGQVFDACERNLKGQPAGTCYGFSVIGSLWKVFKYTKPGSAFHCLTGEGETNRVPYMDVSNESQAMLIDACLRELRQHMGFSADGIRPDAVASYPRPPASRDQLRYFHELKRDGWQYEPGRKQFMKLEQGAWTTHHYVFPPGLL